MADVPSSDSEDSEKNDTFKGLSNASIHLGEGAILYLQTVKTLAILFFILSLINIPIMLMYANSTYGNQYEKIDQVFKYFTLGNIGQTYSVCGYTSVEFKDVQKPDLTDKSYGQAVDKDIKLSCPESGYISQMQVFGFLYMLDYEAGVLSHPNNQCKKVD